MRYARRRRVEILRRSRTGATDTHVFTLHAELDGQKLFAQFEFLLRRWREAGIVLSSLHDYHQQIDEAGVARRELVWGTTPGRSGNAGRSRCGAVTRPPASDPTLLPRWWVLAARRSRCKLADRFGHAWPVSIRTRARYAEIPARDARQRRLGHSASEWFGLYRKTSFAVLGHRNQRSAIRSE